MELTDENSYMYLGLMGTEKDLRTEIPEFDFSNPSVDPERFFNSMKEAVLDKRGYGLSANQVGWHVRMFVFGDPQDSDSITPVFNPKIVYYSDETEMGEEGCLSYPDLSVKVKRPYSIRARYQDLNGETHTQTMNGLTARIFQHETDHLNGILFTDRATRYHLERGQKDRKKIRRLRKRRNNNE